MFTLDLEGGDWPTFFVNTGVWSENFGGDCYTILQRTGTMSYPEIGYFRKGFTELALHEKVNGLHSIECRYPVTGDYHVRELYVFDGTRYNIVVRSWSKDDKPES